MVMQVLAWMWCIIFAMSVGSVTVFGISAIAHALLIAGVFITAGVFETARRKPNYFGGLGRGNGGEHE
jgi:formate hydrogenlyase subunit 3/multisubunit Na+/H+ antiporter MnhD subunit